MIVLTPGQIYFKEAIEWLMSDAWGHRGVGRTYLMCIILIEKAIKSPTVWIPVWDHGPHHPRKEDFMLQHIQKIVDEHYPNWRMKVHVVNKCFSLEPSK